MNEDFIDFKVYKMGTKLGLSFPDYLIDKLKLNLGETIKVYLRVNGQSHSFLSKLNSIVTLRQKTIKELNLTANQIIEVKIEKPVFSDRPLELFNKNKIDLLYLIPNKNRLGFEILVNEFNKNNESWLKVWYCFNRGSCKELELKRFIDIKKFGKFLGLMQSEGTKTNIDVMEFCNKAITEHLDFINYLAELGIVKKDIVAKLDYHPKIKEIEKITFDFEKQTGIKIRYAISGPTSGGGYGFKLIVRSRLFAEIVYNSLKQIRGIIKQKVFTEDLDVLRNAFFSKLLSGDGNIDISCYNRKKSQIRLKICDGNITFLEDYKKIMEVYNLKPHICEKENFVRSYIDYEFTGKLIHMGAFENNPNYEKLLKYLELTRAAL
jgi:hypothetical protein